MQNQIRNIAIIAHVDHGKTTLTDEILKFTGTTQSGFSMDTNDLEKERGITIYAKNTSVKYSHSSTASTGSGQAGSESSPTKINILDTPGHADFGSEVERVLRSIDSVLLVVDAAEGPMPQTKFVLKKSLDLGLKPILVLNKIDKPGADINRSHDQVFDLFADLGASDEQLDFTTIYSIGRDGVAKKNIDDEFKSLAPLLDTILEKVKPASSNEKINSPLQAQVFNLGYDPFLGRMGIARIYNGTLDATKPVIVKRKNGENYKAKIVKLFTFTGVEREEVKTAIAGDIAMIAGLPDIFIGETITDNEQTPALPAITVDEPTVSLFMFLNDSPFAGKSGKFLTGRQIRERLEKELEVNVGLKVDFSNEARFKVSGRGEMHLAVLIENMRREGYELAVSQPEVIIKEEDGQKLEPFEDVSILVPEEFSGSIIEKLGKRKGIMQGMEPEGPNLRLNFSVPTRGLLGYRNEFTIDTKGEGILTSIFSEFKPYAGSIAKTELGSMVSMATGKALAFSIANLQERGNLYIEANDEVYEGMVIGNTSKGEDMLVNPTKGKQLTNMRASGSDGNIKLTPPVKLTLEKALGLMLPDEYLEATPDAIRLRKSHLKESERKRAGSKV